MRSIIIRICFVIGFFVLTGFDELFLPKINRHKAEFTDDYLRTKLVKIDIEWEKAMVIFTLPDSIQFGKIHKYINGGMCTYDFPIRYNSYTNLIWLYTGSSFMRPMISSSNEYRYTEYNSKLDAWEVKFYKNGRYSREVNFNKINLVVLITETPRQYQWLVDTIINNIQVINNVGDSISLSRTADDGSQPRDNAHSV